MLNLESKLYMVTNDLNLKFNISSIYYFEF